MKFIIETDSEELVEEIRAKVNRMDELDIHAMEKNPEIAYISEGNDDYPYWVLGNKSQFYSTRFHYISYWMPLPEPPKEGDTR